MNAATTSKTALQIFNEITHYINSHPYNTSDWYAGITQDINQRLFDDHNVSKGTVWWIYRSAANSGDARWIEQKLLEWGCDGGSGGGNYDAVYVYAYLKTSNTKR